MVTTSLKYQEEGFYLEENLYIAFVCGIILGKLMERTGLGLAVESTLNIKERGLGVRSVKSS